MSEETINANIIREPTETEKKDFKVLGSADVMSNFTNELHLQMQKAVQKGIPFADKAARDDYKDYFEGEKTRIIRQFGYLKVDEVKKIKFDWNKYCDLKNFEVISEGEQFDEHLSKRHNVDVYVQYKEYKFKGYSTRYTVMEPGTEAVRRAKKSLEANKK